MDHLTKLYKSKAEDLQEQVKFLEKKLKTILNEAGVVPPAFDSSKSLGDLIWDPIKGEYSYARSFLSPSGNVEAARNLPTLPKRIVGAARESLGAARAAHAERVAEKGRVLGTAETVARGAAGVAPFAAGVVGAGIGHAAGVEANRAILKQILGREPTEEEMNSWYSSIAPSVGAWTGWELAQTATEEGMKAAKGAYRSANAPATPSAGGAAAGDVGVVSGLGRSALSGTATTLARGLARGGLYGVATALTDYAARKGGENLRDMLGWNEPSFEETKEAMRIAGSGEAPAGGPGDTPEQREKWLAAVTASGQKVKQRNEAISEIKRRLEGLTKFKEGKSTESNAEELAMAAEHEQDLKLQMLELQQAAEEELLQPSLRVHAADIKREEESRKGAAAYTADAATTMMRTGKPPK